MTQAKIDPTQPVHADHVVSVTQFKRSPLRMVENVTRSAGVSRLVVLAYNKPAFYVISPEDMDRLAAAARLESLEK